MHPPLESHSPDLSVAVLMGKVVATHPQAVVAFTCSFRFPLTLTPPPTFVPPNKRAPSDEEAIAETADAAEAAPTVPKSSSADAATPAPAPAAAEPPAPAAPATIDSSAWFALSDETKFALALETFLSEWQGCAWAGDARFEMTRVSVPPVVVSISPIDVQVIPESPTLKYMVNAKMPLDWMLGLVSGQIPRDAPLPPEVQVTESEPGDWKRFLAAFDFTKKAFATAQAALKHREEESSGLVKERDDVELCFALLTHSYFRASRWTGSIRLRIQLKTQGAQDVTRTVVLPPPKSPNPRVNLLPHWDTLVAPLLATLTMSSDAWLDILQAKNTILNMLFDKRIQTDNIAGLIKFANSFSFGEKRFVAFVSHHKARGGKLNFDETTQLLAAADEHSFSEWFSGLVKKGMDSSIYLYEKLSANPAAAAPSGTPAATNSTQSASAPSPPPHSPALPSPAPVSVSVVSQSPPSAAGTAAEGAPKPPATSALRDLDKCVDDLLQIATEKQGHTEAEQAALIEKLKAYIDAQKKQGE